MQISNFGDSLLVGRPPQTPEQQETDRELARRHLLKHAPDLVQMVLGEPS